MGRPEEQPELDVVTGAFSYTGRHIAEALLARGRRVRTLTRRPPAPAHPLAGQVEVASLAFEDTLEESLRGADTLYNTYWVRFERGGTTFDGAVRNTRRLFEAALRAGVSRIVHVSVANPSLDSPFPYYRGKARAEEALRELGCSHAVVRPTLTFGSDDILINNLAWALRHLPLFLVTAESGAPVQPVSVRDVAAICVEAGVRGEGLVLDAAGPDRLSFLELVRLVRDAVRGRARIVHAPRPPALAVARAAGVLLRDVVVTRDELEALGDGLLASHEPARGSESFTGWVAANGDSLGRRYTSELARNFSS